MSVDVCSLHGLLKMTQDHQPGGQPLLHLRNKFIANVF